MTRPRASNWVDRGHPAERKLSRCLGVYLGLEPAAGEAKLGEQAVALLHMVAADASEVQVASYLRSLEEQFSATPPAGPLRRTMAIALWHIAKAALVRDRLLELVKNPPPPPTADSISLSQWLAQRLLRGELPPRPPETGRSDPNRSDS